MFIVHCFNVFANWMMVVVVVVAEVVVVVDGLLLLQPHYYYYHHHQHHQHHHQHYYYYCLIGLFLEYCGSGRIPNGEPLRVAVQLFFFTNQDWCPFFHQTSGVRAEYR